MHMLPRINGTPDTLARPKHVVLSSPDGREWSVIAVTDEPLAMVRMQVETQHAVGFHAAHAKIIEKDTGKIVASFNAYTPPPATDGIPSPERLAMRDRWLDRVMLWMLGERKYQWSRQPDKQGRLARYLARRKIAISLHPNGAVRILRDDKVLAEWG